MHGAATHRLLQLALPRTDRRALFFLTDWGAAVVLGTADIDKEDMMGFSALHAAAISGSAA